MITYKHNNSYLHRCHYCSWYCTYSLFDSRCCCCTMPCHNFALYLFPFCVFWPAPKCLGNDDDDDEEELEKSGWEDEETMKLSLAGGYDRAISRSEQRGELPRSVKRKESDDVRREKRPASALFARLQSSRETGIVSLRKQAFGTIAARFYFIPPDLARILFENYSRELSSFRARGRAPARISKR